MIQSCLQESQSPPLPIKTEMSGQFTMSVSGIYLLWKHNMLRITANQVNKTAGIHILIVPVNITAILFLILLVLLYT